jgi:hypothetical protein
MTSPVIDIEDALYTKLNVASVTGAGATGVFNRIAPENQALPYVIYQWQGGGDANITPRRSRNLVYTVKAVATTLGAAGAIDSAIDALLHMQTISISTGGWATFWVAREQDIAYEEVDPRGLIIYHTGGMYRIRFDK